MVKQAGGHSSVTISGLETLHYTIAKMLIYAKGKWKQKLQIKLMHLCAHAPARSGAGISSLLHINYTKFTKRHALAHKGRLAHISHTFANICIQLGPHYNTRQYTNGLCVAGAEAGVPISRRDWIVPRDDKFTKSVLFPNNCSSTRKHGLPYLQVNGERDRGFYSKNNTPEQKLIIL